MKYGHSIHFAFLKNLTALFAVKTYFQKKRAAIAVLLMCSIMMPLGCGGPSIDASSENSMRTSIEHIRTRLDTSDRAEFDAALNELNDILFNTTDAVTQATISLYRPEALLRKILHGKSAREVITMVMKYRREQLRLKQQKK